MEIKVFDKVCIFTPLSPILDKREAERLKNEIKIYKDFKIGINLGFVENCSIEFIEHLLKERNINLYNISLNIFTILTLMNLDKKIPMYVSELDFLENSRQLLNRKFQLV